MNLALVDKNPEALSQAASQFANDEAVTETYAMDVSKLDTWKELRSKVESQFKRVDFLMLNAGIGLKGGWEDAEYFEQVLPPSSSFSRFHSLNHRPH